MATERFDIEKHKDVIEWFRLRGEGVIEDGVLPPLGMVSIDESGKPIAAAWAYQPIGSKVVFIDWLISKPMILLRDARKHLREAVSALEAACDGAKFAMASSPYRGIVAEATKIGYSVTSRDQFHLAKRL